MNKDDLLLSEAYSQVYNEGTGARVNYMGQGVKAAAGNLFQNLRARGANALAGKQVVDLPSQTAGQAYQAAGGKWLVDDFVKKAQAEITDFYNDAKKMGVDASNIDAIRQIHPEIADQLQKVTGLLDFLKGGGGQAGGQDAPAASTPAPSTATGTQQQATGGGTVQGIPHGVQRNANTNTSFSMANPQPVMKQVNELPKQEPVQKAMPKQPEQEAELVGGEEAQKESPTQGYVDKMAKDDGKKPKAAQSSPNGSTATLNGVNYKKNEQGAWQRLTKTNNVQSVAAGKDIPELEKQAAAQKAEKDAGWKKTGAAKTTKKY